MPQPLSNPDLRRRNLSLLLDTLLRSGEATRKQIEIDSGLSKATVSRLVDELIDQGLVESGPTKGDMQGRGRRPDSLAIPASLGQVVGISFGVRRTVVRANDLANRDLFQGTEATPQLSSAAEAIAWLCERITEARSHSDAPLRCIAIAVPARVVDGEVVHPPLWMSILESHPIAAALSEIFNTEVVLDSDANMALAGLIAQEIVPATESQLLLNMGTVLTVAWRRRDGSFAQGRSDAFGNFSLVPFHWEGDDSTLGAMLSTYGLERFCEQTGVPLSGLPDLWEQPDTSNESARLAFVEALINTLRIICITLDPPTLLLVGRLMPLVESVMPEVTARLGAEISELPKILSLPLFGTSHSPAHGAVHIALTQVQTRLRDQLLLGS